MKFGRSVAGLFLVLLSMSCALGEQDAVLKDMSTEDLLALYQCVRNELCSRESVVNPSSESDFLTVSNDKETYIRAYLGAGGDVVIPNEINGKPVTVISNKAFNKAKSINRLTLPDTLRRIEDDSFSYTYCKNNDVLVFPKSLEYIGSKAMIKSMTGITGIVFQSSCKLAGVQSMAWLDEVKFIYIAKDSDVSIGHTAFQNYPSLMTVVIPASVTIISDSAFEDCPRMTIVTPEGSYAHQYAQRLMIPCNTQRYEELDAYYNDLYISQ